MQHSADSACPINGSGFILLLVNPGDSGNEDNGIPAHLLPPGSEDHQTAEILVADKKTDRLTAEPLDDVVDEPP
ncbi:hypothetical protein D3C75_692440 [compost metagenome]